MKTYNFLKSAGLIFVLFSFHNLALCQKINWALYGVKSSSPFHDGLAIFQEGFWGAINTSGEVAIPPKFYSMTNFTNGTAVVKTEAGEGIINRNGNYVLQPVYGSISRDRKRQDVFEVRSLEGSKYGLFYDCKFVLPVEYEYVNARQFPFVTFKENGKYFYLNAITGEKFDMVYPSQMVTKCIRNGKCFLYYNDGTPYPYIEKSSKGVSSFIDGQTNLIGFRDSKGQVVIPPKYKELEYETWVNDIMIAFDSISVSIPKRITLISNDGKEQVLIEGNNIGIITKSHYILAINNVGSKSTTLYDIGGKKIASVEGLLYPIEETTDWFINLSVNEFFDAKHNKKYNGNPIYDAVHDNMITFEDNNCWYVINAETGKKINRAFQEKVVFHDNMAVVLPLNSKYQEIIDKNGNTLFKESENIRFGVYSHYVSEGVFPITKTDDGWIHGYIYSPLGHSGYTYNQKKYTDDVIEKWNKIGDEAFAKKQYATAKDYYYRVMMNDPTNVSAIINYGAALGNMGYYDEAIESCRIALDIDPDNQLAKDNLRINLDNKRKEEERQQQTEEEEREERSTKSSAFWDALGNFANILSSIAGGENVYQPYSSFSMDTDYSSSYSKSGGSNHDYQSEYNRWANIAQRHYNSLTNLGYRVKHKDGSRSGGTLSSMSGSKYVQMKKSLRDAQHEMQRIRRKAAQNGVTITPSNWETATVGY